MAEVWKVELHCIDDDGDAVEWLEDMEEARRYAAGHSNIKRIDAVTTYHDDRRTVWTRDGGDDDEDADAG